MRVRTILTGRTCQSLLAGFATIALCADTCDGQIPVVENGRAPVVQVAPVIKASGNKLTKPIPIVDAGAQTKQPQTIAQVTLMQPLPAPVRSTGPIGAGVNNPSPIPVVQSPEPTQSIRPNASPVLSGNGHGNGNGFDRPVGSMVQSSSVLPSGYGSQPVAPPRIGLPTQPVFDGSWTPVPPEPVSSSSFNNQPMSPIPAPPTGKYLGKSPPADGQVEFESDMSVPNNHGCDCGSRDCNECSRFGIALPSRPMLQRPGIVEGYGPVSRLRGRLSGMTGNGTRYGMCGFCPDATRYLIADAMYWSRGDGDVVGNNFGGVSGANNWDLGWRFTAGARRDCVSGVEATYMGMTPITDSLTSNSAGGNINARFTPAGGFNALQTGSFFNATQTVQQARTQLHSIELNRVRYSWDVARTHLGMRYIWLEDDYSYRSTSAAGTGVYSFGALNHMIGPEAGLDLYYDVGKRVSFSGFGKLGGYLNFNRIDTDLVNNGTTYLNNRNTDTNLSGTLDLGANALMHITQNARLRVGYNALWLWSVASYDDNFPQFMTPTTGQNPDPTSNTFLHGVNFGIEIYR